eukprot:6456763-Amphidinium_carterae.1
MGSAGSPPRKHDSTELGRGAVWVEVVLVDDDGVRPQAATPTLLAAAELRRGSSGAEEDPEDSSSSGSGSVLILRSKGYEASSNLA